MRKRHFAAIVWLSVLLLFGVAWARSGSFMGRYTGAPGDSGNCTGCHSGTANSGSGIFDLTAPADYVAGDTIDISIALAQTGQVRWGFELTALDASNQPVGQLIVSDPTNTRSQVSNGRTYVWHTSTGTYNGTANASPGWTVKWTNATPGAGDVTFWAAGLAADGSGTGGDFTYTTSRTVNEQIGTAVNETGGQLPGSFALAQNLPNPFNPSTRIEYSLSTAASVELTVFNVIGQKVITLDQGQRSPGVHSLTWNGTNSAGQRVAGGVYFYRLQVGNDIQTRRMLYLK